jgi:DNA adenine methylase
MDNQTRASLPPFIKWLGGKRWLMPIIENEIGKVKPNRFFEPFLGGGAFYFHFRFQSALLSDINPELINAYIQVRDKPKNLEKAIKALRIDRETYFRVRNTNPADPLDRAVRFLYLNRTAFRGIYRVNQKGQFNVPYGNYENGTKTLLEDGTLTKASEALQGVDILCADFEMILDQSTNGDLVYCDPIYTVVHNNNGFRQYNEKCFAWADQERLSRACKRAADRGASIIISNACHDAMTKLYKGFKCVTVERKSPLSPYHQKHRTVFEYLFTNNVSL